MEAAATITSSSTNVSRPNRLSTQGTSLFAQLHATGSRQRIAPARRKPTSHAAKEFDILEDEEATWHNRCNEGQEQKNTSAGLADDLRPIRPLRGGSMGIAQKRTSLVGFHSLHEAHESMPAIREDGRPDAPTATQLRRGPRRRTIFVPPDDTTLLTIHPGMKERRDDATLDIATNQAPQQGADGAENPKENINGRLRRPARTSILAAPRRGPLQAMQRLPPHQNGTVVDRNGTLTGKENIAPGGMRDGKTTPLAISGVAKPTARPRPSVSTRRDSVLLAKPASSIIARNMVREPVPRTASQSPEQQGREKVARLTSSASTTHRPSTQQKAALDLRNYPPLQEDIAHARLFEESWLTNQEHVLVELINEVFAQSEATRLVPKHKTLRETLLQFYQDRATLRLHQRLQASLQFGTLSVPKDSDCKNETYRYTKDVGRRQRFVKLWAQTYMPTFLRAALEAVIGRQMKAQANESCTSRDLTVFVEGFLLRNEDAQSPSHLHTELESTAWAWRRTMQRSLMLVYMLDKAKESLSLDGNLFRPKSPYKTSAAVLSELSNILHPSERNVQQCLSHLGYKVTYEQHPIADYHWPIANLAVDLRDGIRLARLVELLLPPWQPAHADFERRPSWNNADRNAIDPNSTGRYLAPHLRVPCNSRAAMLANNELVLRAMRDSHCLDSALQEIEAVDLADGHRERTLALLWSVVGTAGLQRLVDWEDVRSEIVALGGTVSLESPKDNAGQHRAHLLSWTSLIAARHDLSVKNMSSAFADGRIFEAIIDEYTPLIPITTPTTTSASSSSSLESKLLNLGSSPSFASVFGRLRFLDQEFVHATLLFLAARLLTASRPERVRRAALKRLATDCATVVQTRLRLEEAAQSLQRGWRAYRARGAAREERKEEKKQKRDGKGVLDREVDVEFWMV